MLYQAKKGFLAAALLFVSFGAPARAEILEEALYGTATALKAQYDAMDQFLLWIIGGICVFVTLLVAYVALRFRAGRNPVPDRFSHNTLVEIIWTIVPVIILVIIVVPSLRLLDRQLTVPEVDITIKATGQQWYWDYEYPDEDIVFPSFMIGQGAATYEEAADALREAGHSREEWLLATDAPMVVPVGKTVRVLVTADPGGVIHAWTVPAFGVKIDAIPGRLNETWFRAEKTGVFYGQCSMLCGVYHAYMPIMVRVVTEEEYAQWLETARLEYGSLAPGSPPDASASASSVPDPSRPAPGRLAQAQ